MTAEQIVRALAACDAPVDRYDDVTECMLCNSRNSDDYGHHDACPWRLAKVWVRAHPAAADTGEPT